ncbi:hypothetical protein [Nocardioides cynanchi]|uniref:hypothetical protein n=1 Tax=Nocardioides cynanchi TaxID=2558918 RepID=UPI001248F6DB|nr:hypothetical protein [Nocardioides cynanchi]
MTDHDLQTLLREHVSSDEPAFRASPSSTIARGNRVRRLRSGAVALSTAAVLGVGAVALHSLPDRSATAVDPGFSAGGDTVAQHLLATSAEAFGATEPDLPDGQVLARDGDLRPVSPDSAAAQYVTVGYALPDGHTLRVSANGVDPGDLARADESCASGLADGLYASCTLTHRADGSLVMTSVGAIGAPQPDGSHQMLTASHPRTQDSAVYYLRSVTVIDAAQGVTGSASEVVHTATAGEAADAWTVPVSTLRDLAGDPALAGYDLPTNPAPRTIG